MRSEFTQAGGGSCGLPASYNDKGSKRTRSYAAAIRLSCNLAETFEQFLEARQRPSDPKPLSKKTVRSYGQALEEFRPVLCEAKHEEMLVSAIQEHVDARLESGEIGSSGMNVYLRALNSFLSWCLELGYLQTELRVPLLPIDRRQPPRTLKPEEIEAWRQFPAIKPSEHRIKQMALMILDTGVRAEECLALRECDVDWSGSRLWVDKGKGGSNRQVPISTEGKKALRRYLAQSAKLRPHDQGCTIFCTSRGTPCQYRNALRDLKKVGQRIGMSWVSWHSFRRTFSTQYIRNGGLLTDLQKILGHTELRTTVLYLGSEIDEIVAIHDQYSPISTARKRRPKSRQVN